MSASATFIVDRRSTPAPPGAELIYPPSGTQALHVGDEQYMLEARDAIFSFQTE